MKRGMNDAEAYHKIYGELIYKVPFYQARYVASDSRRQRRLDAEVVR